MEKEFSIFDIEANGLNPTKIYVVSVAKYKNGEFEYFSITDYEEMKKFFLNEKTLVGHNIIRWDIPNIERILDIKIKAKLVDTLSLSWYLYPLRAKHGLESWGEEFGVLKPEIEDWHNLELSEYIHRCKEDVKINVLLFLKQIKYLDKIYLSNIFAISSLISYLSFKLDCAREQEENPLKLDINKLNKTLNILEEVREKKKNILRAIMPRNIKYTTKSRPSRIYKKDGNLTQAAIKWFRELNKLNLPETHLEDIKVEVSSEDGNPSSSKQLKDWLLSLGWQPQTFSYVKNKETQEIRKIPQVNLPFGQGICPSVKLLYKDYPLLQNLEELSVISHRIGLLKGFLKNSDAQGYIKAEVAGFTNTLRFKHTNIVNLPKVTKKHTEENPNYKDGIHIRGMLIAEEGYKLLGSDMSSLEDRTKQHYMFKYDPEYVKSMMNPDFDPHLDLAEFAGALTHQQVLDHKNKVKDYGKIRYDYKQVNYSAIYGVSPATLSRNANMPLEKAKGLLSAYWKKNWSVKRVVKDLIVKTIDGQMWQYNPVSGFWYTLRYKKDGFSTLNQGTASFVFDYWVKEIRDNNIKISGQFHDEVIIKTPEGSEDFYSSVLRNSIENVNKKLKLNRDLDIDISFGNNYGEVH